MRFGLTAFLRRNHNGFRRFSANVSKLGSLTQENINEIIGEAVQLKKSFKSNHIAAIQTKPLLNKNICVLRDDASSLLSIPIETGVNLLGGNIVRADITKFTSEKVHSYLDFGLYLSKFSDLVVTCSDKQTSLPEISRSSQVPVINFHSGKHLTVLTLSMLMTLQEKLGPLKGLSLSWIGDAHSSNHMAELIPELLRSGVNVCLTHPSSADPKSSTLEKLKKIASESGSRLDSTHSMSNSIADANAILCDQWSTTEKFQEGGHYAFEISKYVLAPSHLEAAATNSVFFQTPLFTKGEISQELIHSPRNVSFDMAENQMWIFMSLALNSFELGWGEGNVIQKKTKKTKREPAHQNHSESPKTIS